MGRRCGRRERRADAGGQWQEGVIPRASRRSSRNGERHPGSQDAVSLRGRTEKCESWPVRLRAGGALSHSANAPATTGVLWKNEEGNVVSVRQAHALVEVAPNKRLPDEDSSFARSRDPCTSIVTELRGRKSTEVARRSRYRGRANPRKWERTGNGILIGGRIARLAAYHRSSRSRATAIMKRSCVMRQKRKVVLAIVPARKRESRAQCPYVVFQVAEVGRQHPGPE